MLSNHPAHAPLPPRWGFTAGKQTIPLQQSFSKKLLFCLFWMRDGILNVSGLDSALS